MKTGHQAVKYCIRGYEELGCESVHVMALDSSTRQQSHQYVGIPRGQRRGYRVTTWEVLSHPPGYLILSEN